MGYYASLIQNKKYKRWKRHQMGIDVHDNPIYDEPEISPLPGSTIKYRDMLRIEVIDDVGLVGHNFYWYIHLYDFVKEGKVITQTQYIVNKGDEDAKKTVYYDEGLDEKLGGEKQKTGGQ